MRRNARREHLHDVPGQADCTVIASFSINTITITASAGANGSISPSGSVVTNYGADQTFAITADTGYSVSDVLVDGASKGAMTAYTFSKVSANHTISVSFTINTYAITATTADPNGSISCAPLLVDYGANSDCMITPNTCYSILDVQVDGSSVGAVTGYTFNAVTANHAISASFAAVP